MSLADETNPKNPVVGPGEYYVPNPTEEQTKQRVMNLKVQEVVTNGRRAVRYKGSDGKMHDLASSENESTASEPVNAHTEQTILIVDTRESNIPSSDEVIAALHENREVLYIIDDAKYKHYSRSVSTYESDFGDVVHILTPGGKFQHKDNLITLL